ncbi:MAG: thiamine pyrophosphate-binding protein [Pseudomonadota bacterium]
MRHPCPPVRTGGKILVDQLLIHGADTAFCVPGESYLSVLDALHDVTDDFTLINARHEAGAANMAEAYGKLTGKPGICMVTRGPGACHASIGVHISQQDSTPMILLIGQVSRQDMGREAFQEIDYRYMFGSIAKWVAQIDIPERIPEYMARAFHTATSGRAGPVVLALPEDMLAETASCLDSISYLPSRPGPQPTDLDRIRAVLKQAQYPIMILGGNGWTDEDCQNITNFAEANGLPVVSSFRRQDIVDNDSDCYVGDLGISGPPTLVKRLEQADTLLVVGARLGEITTKNYTTLSIPSPRQRLVHIHIDPDEIGRVFAPEVGLVSAPEFMASALAGCRWFNHNHWQDWRETLKNDYLIDITVTPSSAQLDLNRAFMDLRNHLPSDAIVTLDAGNHTGWAQRFLHYGRPGREIGSTCGAMGYAVPAAVSASLVYPERIVIACVGDGGFMMSGQEIATAIQHNTRIIVLLFNNGFYGTIRMHQEREYPERVMGTSLANPDFISMARALGAYSDVVTATDDLCPAIDRAIDSGQPAVIELRTDPEQISTRTTITSLRNVSRKLHRS